VLFEDRRVCALVLLRTDTSGFALVIASLYTLISSLDVIGVVAAESRCAKVMNDASANTGIVVFWDGRYHRRCSMGD